MAHRTDDAIRRAADRKTLIVAHPDQNLAPAEITRAAESSTGLPMYGADAVIVYLSGVILTGLLLPRASSMSGTDVSIAMGAAFAFLFVMMVLVPLGRRYAARELLSRLDLASALELDLPNEEALAESNTFNSSWGRESKVRARHLQTMWEMAEAGRLHPQSGLRFRASHGKCSGCGATEKQWCTDDCSLLDPTDYR